MSLSPDPPDRSPSLLSGPPKRGVGVRRLNRLPIAFAIGGAMLVVAAIGYTYHARLMQSAANADKAAQQKPAPGNGSAVLNGAPAGGEVIPAVLRTPLPAGSGQGRPVSPPPTLPADGNAAGGQPSADDDAAKARREAWQAYYAELAQLRKDRLAAATSAMTADTGMSSSNGSGTQPVTPGAGTATPAALTGAEATAGESGRSPGAPGFVPAVQPGGFGLPIYPPARVDTTAQREKQAFLSQPGDVTGNSDDLLATLRDPSSPFLVMAGTAIPAVMIGGINSDMPGMVIGQVSTNVYDTATGRYLLIPQGARLIGSYDNMVANGQTRVGVIWNRIIYPDTQSIDLGSMEGADQGGYAGFHDQVNTHFWSKIGNALLISIAGAGVQLSQGTGQTTNGYNAQQIAAASLGQQFGELGQEYARAGLSIPNTLEIRPGYRFVVMVNKDMHLRPYVDQRMGTAQPPGTGLIMR